MIKRISLSILLTLITFAAWADAISVPNNGKNIYYEISQDGTYAIVTTSPEDDLYYGDIVIPASITVNGNTYPVTTIGVGAFIDRRINSIVLPNSITTMEPRAFMNCKFTSITLPDNLTAVSDGAFTGCSYLETVTLPEGIQSIGAEAFFNCM